MQVDIRTFKSFPRLKKHFLIYVNKECFLDKNKDYCWIWKGAKRSGYGRISWGRTRYEAHRMSYMIFNGPIPYDKIIRHTCDNPGCVNPNHLILGTESENINDSVLRNRRYKQILNIEAVKVIKWVLKYKSKYGVIKKLALLHGVHRSTIDDIKHGLNWNWVKIY